MNRGRSKFTSGEVRRQGTEVHEDRRTKRRRTRADVEREAIEQEGLLEGNAWRAYYESLELEEFFEEDTKPRRRRT